MSWSSNADAYRVLRKHRTFRRVLVTGLFLKLPVVAIPLTLTLHVIGDLSRSVGEAGLLVALWTVGVAVGSPLSGRLIDHKGLRPVLAVSILAQGVFWATAADLDFVPLAVASVASGAFLVPGTTVTRIAVAALVPKKEQPAAFAFDAITTNVSYMIGPALVVALSTRVGSSFAFLSLGICLVIAMALIVAINPYVKTDEEGGASLAAASTDCRRTSRRATRVAFGRLVTSRSGGVGGPLLCALMAGVVSSGCELALIAALDSSGNLRLMPGVVITFGVSSIIGGLTFASSTRHPRSFALILATAFALIGPSLSAQHPVVLAMTMVPVALVYAPVFAATAAEAAGHASPGTEATVASVYGVFVTAGTALGGPAVGAVVDAGGAQLGFAAIGLFAALIGVSARALTGGPATAEHAERQESVLTDHGAGDLNHSRNDYDATEVRTAGS